jgi:HSP20 family molecular chaperone IbpA
MASRKDLDAWMWAEACELLGRAERLQRQFFQPPRAGASTAAWEPPVDVFEDEREIVIVVAMPGVPASRVQVAQEGSALLVRGSRPMPLSASGHAVRHLEIPYGAFERRIALPAGHFHIGSPALSDGCLVIRLIKL